MVGGRYGMLKDGLVSLKTTHLRAVSPRSRSRKRRIMRCVRSHMVRWPGMSLLLLLANWLSTELSSSRLGSPHTQYGTSIWKLMKQVVEECPLSGLSYREEGPLTSHHRGANDQARVICDCYKFRFLK